LGWYFSLRSDTHLFIIATYLNILDAKKGSALKHLGITRGKDPEVMAQVGLDEYKKLLDDAAAETSDLNKRYEKYHPRVSCIRPVQLEPSLLDLLRA